ncbi:MAG: LemA protein [Rhodothermales bacterium]|jgi:LemA protein
MPGILTTLIVFLASILMTIAWMYNRLVRHKNIVSEAWAGIDVQLQKRHELVPNLVATVKAYVEHESGVHEWVSHIRTSKSAGVSQTSTQESALSRSLTSLFALAEDYPDLKASEGFQQLHISLIEIEDHLQYARRYYNGAVRDNNNAVESFPSNLIAGIFNFSIAEFFEIEFSAQREAPEVELWK